MRFQQVVQHFLRRFQRDRPSEQIRVRGQAVQRTLQLPHVRRDFMRQIFQHLLRYGRPRSAGLRFEDGKPQLIRRGVQVGDHAAPEPGFQAGFQIEFRG